MTWQQPEIGGWMGVNELDWLYRTAQKMSSIVEIGCWFGRSTYALCSGCPGDVYAVDHFKGSSEHQADINSGTKPFDKFLENVGHFRNLHIMPIPSRDAARVMKGNFDMVFIDGAHEYEFIKEDLELWAPRAKRLVCGHDFFYDSIRKALKDYFGLEKEVGTAADNIWEIRK